MSLRRRFARQARDRHLRPDPRLLLPHTGSYFSHRCIHHPLVVADARYLLEADDHTALVMLNYQTFPISLGVRLYDVCIVQKCGGEGDYAQRAKSGVFQGERTS